MPPMTRAKKTAPSRDHDLAKNQQTRQRGQTFEEEDADQPFGFELKPMLDEYHERDLLGRDGLCGPDKSPDVNATRGQPPDSGAGNRSTPQDVQHGADVRAQPSMVQKEEALP